MRGRRESPSNPGQIVLVLPALAIAGVTPHELVGGLTTTKKSEPFGGRKAKRGEGKMAANTKVAVVLTSTKRKTTALGTPQYTP